MGSCGFKTLSPLKISIGLGLQTFVESAITFPNFSLLSTLNLFDLVRRTTAY